MYRILTASKDNYITNKIINNKFRVTDANVGQAATLDIFKLYAESVTGSNDSPTEISRALVAFDLNPLRQMTGSALDIGHSSFKCTLKLFDVYGGQTTPSNFKIIVFPLSQSFNEGVGRDVVKFQDLDASNYITASVSGDTAVAWFNSGANKQGTLGSDDIDIISSGTIAGKGSEGVVNLWKSQTFSTGEEDLSIDVTTIVSATLKNILPDCGFRISYSGSQETDSKTRFVKRFGSTQNSDYTKRPRLEIVYDDSTQDHHRSFFFDISGSLFLNNFHRGSPANALTETNGKFYGLSGSNCMHLILRSGSVARGTYFTKTVTASQHAIGSNYVTGVYSASFLISKYLTGTLRNEIKKAGSASLTEIWSSLDETVAYHTGSVTVNTVSRTSFNNEPKRLLVNVTNMKSSYKKSIKVRFRVFVEDIDRPIKAKKLPFVTPSQIFTSMYYRIRDTESDDVIIPFDTLGDGTVCSTDTDGMYFDVYMDSLEKGRLYTIDFLIKDQGIDQVFTDVASKFKVI